MITLKINYKFIKNNLNKAKNRIKLNKNLQNKRKKYNILNYLNKTI